MTEINFDKNNGLVPVIVQDNQSLEVLMLGYMNRAAYIQTLASGYVYFWSRSRNELWLKGTTSGNKLRVMSLWQDCDADTLLVKATLVESAACHTGNRSCFYTPITKRNI